MTRRIVTPVQYNEKNVKIQTTYNDGNKPITGWTNEETMFFMENGYLVLKNFIPKEVIEMTMDVWKTIEHQPHMHDAIFNLEEDIIYKSPTESLFKSHGGHTTPMGVMMHNYLTKRLNEVLDLSLQETYVYTRKYDRGAYLTAHLDRPSCEVSSTLCLDYKSDDNKPWKIWVKNDRNYVSDDEGKQYDHDYIQSISQSIPIRKRKEDPSMKCITLEVGDMLLYQGPNVIHWRDTFVGDYTYHMFCHWINELGRIVDLPNGQVDVGKGMPHKRSVLAYDGRLNRYESVENQSHEFQQHMKEWNARTYNPKDFVNNFTHIKRVEDK